jgi:hypothetical protein
MLLADHQEAIGHKALRAVDQLNQTTISQFQNLNCFKEALSLK